MQPIEPATPIACNLDAMSAVQRARYESLRRTVQGAVRRVEELPAGFALGFDAGTETLVMLAEFIGLERVCCPFFDFTLELDAGAERSWLKLTGPEPVKALLTSELGLEAGPGGAPG